MFFHAAFIVLPFVAQALAQKQCARSYTVKDGQICDGIASDMNVSTYQLSASNPSINADCSNLAAGMQLCLGYVGEDCTTNYKVVSGDTCEQIAANHNINTTILYVNNPQVQADNCTQLYIGEMLCVAGSLQLPSASLSYMPGASIPATATPANPSAHQTHTAYTTSYMTVYSTPAASGTLTPAPTASQNSGDDDDLPWCDEL